MKSIRQAGLGMSGHWLRLSTAILALTTLAGLLASPAQALPSYARQTGADCASCHVGSFGPQLTPYGQQFKLGGYTDSDEKGIKIPLSAMAVANWTRTSKANPDHPENFNDNNNAALQEASLFLAGRLTDNIGTFVQGTYSGIEKKSSLDQMDIRFARTLKLGETEGVVGLSFNNNPTLTDPFNTIGQWRFPYTSSDFGFGFGPSPLVESLAGSVLGLNAYTLLDKNLYAELGLYNTPSTGTLSALNATDVGKFSGVGTWWRLAYVKDMKRDNFSVGLFGFNANLQPDRNDLGTSNNYKDIGVDAAYQFLGNREHVFSLNASYVHEMQTLNYAFANSESSNSKNNLDQFRLAGSYHYNQTWGATLGLFDSRGTADSGLYGASSYTNRPNTAGYMLQADWTPWGKEDSWLAPWANMRLGIQYTGYTRYNGGSSYISGTDDNGNPIDRQAKDNNTLSLFAWFAI